jgi:hypothetical protein
VHRLAWIVRDIEVRNLECRHRFQRLRNRVSDLLPTPLLPKIPADLAQSAQDLRPIESLTLTVLAKIRHRISASLVNLTSMTAQAATATDD